MSLSFVSEPLEPIDQSFDTSLMAQGEPGLPHRFRWRDQEWEVAEILGRSKAHGDCRNGSGERYVRKHVYRVRTTNGLILTICFQRTMGRPKANCQPRWWVYTMETPVEAGVHS